MEGSQLKQAIWTTEEDRVMAWEGGNREGVEEDGTIRESEGRMRRNEILALEGRDEGRTARGGNRQ